ncbi:MAG: glycerophosphodiester phosphodiesterase family protein [Planctomycetota bacterium]
MVDTTLGLVWQRLATRRPVVVAHRGDSGAQPENTLTAFAAAIDAGAQVIEFDVHASADGIPVCIHDETLDRTTDAATVLGRAGIEVAHAALADLAKLDAGRWMGVEHAGVGLPTLQAALDLMLPRVIPMIEHKGGAAEVLVELLQRLGVVEAVLVQSFDWNFVRRVHSLEPRMMLGVLGEGRLDAESLARIPLTGASLVHWHVHDLRAEDIDELRRRGLLVCVYTANSDVELAGAAALGADAITTNHPARLGALVERGIARPA